MFVDIVCSFLIIALCSPSLIDNSDRLPCCVDCRNTHKRTLLTAGHYAIQKSEFSACREIYKKSYIVLHCIATLDFCCLVHSHITVFRNYQISTSDITMVQYFLKKSYFSRFHMHQWSYFFQRKSPNSTVLVAKDQRGIDLPVVNFQWGTKCGRSEIKRGRWINSVRPGIC